MLIVDTKEYITYKEDGTKLKCTTIAYENGDVIDWCEDITPVQLELPLDNPNSV